MPAAEPQLEARLRRLSRELCAALRAVIDAVLGAGTSEAGGLRPVQLTGGLGLDKSLASRVVRALGDEDELRALHGIPTPQGLALIAAAARARDADEATVERIDAAAAAYRELLGEFSGGRTDLEATLAGWIPEHRARAERDARRSIFRGMTTLSGTRASAIYHALYLVPSADPSKIDSLVVGVRQDLRKLRQGAHLLVGSLRAAPGTGGWGAARTTLDGRPLAGRASALVLPDLCSHPVPQIEVEEREHELVLSLASDALDVNEFTTLGFGWRTPGHFERSATAERSIHYLTSRAIRPAEALVLDLLVHRDVELGGVPYATVTTEPHDPGWKTHGPGEDAPAARPLVDLDAAPGGLASQDVRACPAIAETVCREAGLRLGDFRKLRARVELPLPSEELTVWWRRLPG